MISNSLLSKLKTILSYEDREANTLESKCVFYNFQTLTPDILSAIALSISEKP